MGFADGGYFASEWTLAALMLAVVALAGAVSGAFCVPGSRIAAVALALFGAYAAWTVASIFWSANQGAAWQGAGLTLMYALTVWIGVALVSAGASRRWMLAVSALGPAVVAALTLLAVSFSPEDLFENGRLSGTVGYYNGEAAFLLVPLWVSLYLAGSKPVHPALRGAVLAGAALCAQVAVLAQSRGAAVAVAGSLVVFFLLSGQRLRGLLAFAPVALVLVLAFPGLNDIYLAFTGPGDPGAALERAVPLVWLFSGAAGVYGVLWGLADSRWSPSGTLVRVAGGVALAGVLLAGAAGAFAVNERVGDPAELAQAKWEAFKTSDRSGEQRSRYLSASGQGRYGLWEVAWEDFEAYPLHGVGTHNYEATYYQRRDQPDLGSVRQPHMLALEVLAERGLIGGALLLGFLGVCVGVGLRERFGRLSPEAKAQVAAIIASVAYWFAHSSAEWFWQIPAVTLPVMLYLAILVAPWRQRSGSPLAGWPARTTGIVVVALVVAAIFPLYAAERYLNRSYLPLPPEVALASVEQAERITPVDPLARRREAELAAAAGDRERERAALAEAARLDPEHYVAYALLADSYEENGKPGKAFALYQQALSRNPASPDLNREAIRTAPYASTNNIAANLETESGERVSVKLAKAELDPESRPETFSAENIPEGSDGAIYVWSVNVQAELSTDGPASFAFADANGEIVAVKTTGGEGGEARPPRPYRLAIQVKPGFVREYDVKVGSRILPAPAPPITGG